MKRRYSYYAALPFAAYIMLLFRFLIFRGNPVAWVRHLAQLPEGGWRHSFRLLQFIPGKSIYYYASLSEPVEVCIENLAGNILIFLPLGFLACLCWSHSLSKKRILLFLVLTSLGFETLQLITNCGVFDIDDILLNSLGALSGILLYRFVSQLIGSRLRPSATA